MANLSDVKRKIAQDILSRAVNNFHIEFDFEAGEFYAVNEANNVTYWGTYPADVDRAFDRWKNAVVSNIMKNGDEGVSQLLDECLK